jgi:hypothetical protein
MNALTIKFRSNIVAITRKNKTLFKAFCIFTTWKHFLYLNNGILRRVVPWQYVFHLVTLHYAPRYAHGGTTPPIPNLVNGGRCVITMWPLYLKERARKPGRPYSQPGCGAEETNFWPCWESNSIVSHYNPTDRSAPAPSRVATKWDYLSLSVIPETEDVAQGMTK